MLVQWYTECLGNDPKVAMTGVSGYERIYFDGVLYGGVLILDYRVSALFYAQQGVNEGFESITCCRKIILLYITIGWKSALWYVISEEIIR